jgi:cytochrome-b5 reductase
MLSRSVFRACQPLRVHARHYASEAPKPGAAASSSQNWFLASAGGLLAGGLAWQYLRSPSPPSPANAPTSTSKEGDADAVTGSSPDDAKSATRLGSKVAFTGGDQGFLSLVLDKVELVNHNTKKFTFRLPEDEMVSGLHVASALLAKYKGPEMEKAVIRPYTPIGDEDDKGTLTLLVKRYPDGPMSTRMHDMEPGQRLEFKGPLPKYPWTANQHAHVALVAGGTGITPMYQLTRRILTNPDDRTKVTLVYGNISEDDILLRRELDHLENTYPQRFRAFHVLEKPAPSWTGGQAGRINKDILKTVLPEPKTDGVKVFVCGPPGMMQAISGNKKSPKDQGELAGLLKELGYSQDQVYKF